MNRLLNWPGHAWLGLPMRWYLAYVFIFACLHKIAHPESFAVDVATYDIVPLSLVNLMAIILPWMELAAGIMLLIGFKSRAAAMMVFGMMTMFIIALVMALAEGLDMSCGCFASQGALGEDPISYKTVIRDLGWLALSLYLMVFDNNAIGLDRIFGKRRNNYV